MLSLMCNTMYMYMYLNAIITSCREDIFCYPRKREGQKDHCSLGCNVGTITRQLHGDSLRPGSFQLLQLQMGTYMYILYAWLPLLYV